MSQFDLRPGTVVLILKTFEAHSREWGFLRRVYAGATGTIVRDYQNGAGYLVRFTPHGPFPPPDFEVNVLPREMTVLGVAA